MNNFGEEIRRFRYRSGKSLKEVASYLEIDYPVLHQVEQGRRNPTKDQVLKLAGFLGTDEKKLLTLYLEHRLFQGEKTGKSSARLQNLTMELRELQNSLIKTHFHKPGPPLSSFIRNIIYCRGNSKQHPAERVLPDGDMQLVINLGDLKSGMCPGRSPEKSWVSGIQERFSKSPASSGDESILILFTTGGFSRLTNIPATEIKNLFIPADQIFGPSLLHLREDLISGKNVGTMIGLVEQFFLHKVSEQTGEHSVIRYLIDNITTPLPQLVSKTGYSHKHVIYLFKKYTGSSPKYFQRILRFNRSLHDILSANGKIDWQNIVFQNGFFDQAHFIREFTHFSGMTPNAYQQTGNTCSKLLHMRRFG